MSRFGHRVVRPVGIGNGDVLFAPEVTRNVEDRAFPTILHKRTELTDQAVVRDQVGFHGAVPILQGHVHNHFFGTGNARVIDQEVHLTKEIYCMLMKGIQRLWIPYVDIREDVDAGLWVWIANTPQLVRDFLSRFDQFGFTPGT